MESEKRWAVWSQFFGGIAFWSLAEEPGISKRLFLREMNITHAQNWEDFYRKGYRLVQVTISYEKPQASDED